MTKTKIPLRVPSRASTTLTITCLLLAVLTVLACFFIDTKGVDLGKATLKTLDDLRTMFFEPQLVHLTLGEAIFEVLTTLGLAFLCTLIGAGLSLFLAFQSARNLGNPLVGNLIRSFVAIIRAVPTVLWVLIFAIGAGLGSVAAIVGMTFHTLGYLLKAYSEAFEELDSGAIEALKASGASWWQIIFQAVLPSSLTLLMAWTFIRFEINFTIAVAMGAAAGAGGIGFDLFMASAYYFNIREVGAITILILITALILEFIATRLREANKLHV